MNSDTTATDDTECGTGFEPVSAASTGCKPVPHSQPTRRAMLRRGGKLLIYAAPLIQVFRPTQALAGSGASPTS